ncbi:MAG: glycosyltransferase [Pseudomonadota bacterium]
MTHQPGDPPQSSFSAPTFICQIDTAVHNAHAIFGFGWALDRTGIILRGTLHLQFADGRRSSVRLSMERAREDVAAAFPDCPQAAHAGFMFMAGWGEDAPEKAALLFERADGSLQRTALNLFGPTPAANSAERRYLLRRALTHLRQGRIAELIHKALRHMPPRPRPAGENDRQLAAALNGRRCRLVIDHSMGGGANLFRERIVSRWLAGGDTVVLLSFRLAQMVPFIEVHHRANSLVLTLQRLDELIGILARATLTEIFFNCAVSFPRAEEVQQLVLSLKRRLEGRLVVAMHEYFLVCPSPFLLDSQGQFCGVPSMDRCHSCLPVHEDGFVSLAGERSIERWRRMWGEVLEAADEVRCFSESTRYLLARAYPFIAERMTLRPHPIDPLRPVRTSWREQAFLTVGVIGSILQHKGAQVVADLANAIVEAGANIRIVVVGSIDAACPPDVVEQTGPYRRDALPDLVEKHRIDIALLPSICPETFSFVAHEIVSLGLPLLCLDLGAQADLARSQQAGWVSSRQDGPGLLKELIAFDRHLKPLRLKVLI